ncbi:MAG: hypothetical protein V5A27_04605 [Halapricum sp.]
MVPRILLLGAASGLIALVLAIGTFLMPLPLWLKAFLYLLFSAVFLASVAIFGRLLVIKE